MHIVYNCVKETGVLYTIHYILIYIQNQFRQETITYTCTEEDREHETV